MEKEFLKKKDYCNPRLVNVEIAPGFCLAVSNESYDYMYEEEL